MITALVMQPVILVNMLPATHTAALISNSCDDFSAVGCMCQLLSNHCLLTSGLVIQVLPDSVLAVEVLLSCTGCAVATWLSLRWDCSQAYADWTCMHQLQHLCMRPATVYAAADC